MNEDEAAEREVRSPPIHASRDTLSKDTWRTSPNALFDGTYRHVLRAAKAQGRSAP